MGMMESDKALGILRRYGIPVVESRIVKNASEAARAAEDMGYPVALKVHSGKVVHKTDAGGVALGIGDEMELRKELKAMEKRLARFSPLQFLLQRMASGEEIIIGSKQDPQFGPLVMFGLGGIFVEVLKDVSFRLVPVSRKDVQEMIRGVKGFPVLAGARGRDPVNFKSLEDCIMNVSKLVSENPQIREMDLNPVMASKDGAVAVDFRIMV